MKKSNTPVVWENDPLHPLTERNWVPLYALTWVWVERSVVTRKSGNAWWAREKAEDVARKLMADGYYVTAKVQYYDPRGF